MFFCIWKEMYYFGYLFFELSCNKHYAASICSHISTFSYFRMWFMVNMGMDFVCMECMEFVTVATLEIILPAKRI